MAERHSQKAEGVKLYLTLLTSELCCLSYFDDLQIKSAGALVHLKGLRQVYSARTLGMRQIYLAIE